MSVSVRHIVCETLDLSGDDRVLHLTLNRPEQRNAINETMVGELETVVAAAADDPALRIVVIRGAGGSFCAGGDLKDFQRNYQGADNVTRVAGENRRFGHLLTAINALPQVVIMLVEGAAMGGGVGLTCLGDISICTTDALFSMTETGMGIPPAQIAPFVVQRIGLTHARRLMLSAARFDGTEALRLGLVHQVVSDAAALGSVADTVIAQVLRCGPRANAATKEILRSCLEAPLDETLDMAATRFATALKGDEAREGITAFHEKRAPDWVPARKGA
jgi:isohexenylglutaconyl-CoA hydratase